MAKFDMVNVANTLNCLWHKVLLNKILYSTVVVFLFSSCSNTRGDDTEFTKGVNLSSWLQGNSVKSTPFHRYTEEDFRIISSMGVDVVRLPINLSPMSSDYPDYTIPRLLFEFVDSAAAWAQRNNIHLILDNHSFSFTKKTDASSIEYELVALWKQLSKHYADGYENLYYEILNEPHGIDAIVWGQIQGNIIDTIRKYDQNHTIIVTPCNYASAKYLSKLPKYTDRNLLYTFHFYHPILFTHQGTNFIKPSLENLKALPYPYKKELMPVIPKEFHGTWAEYKFNKDFATEATQNSIEEHIKLVTEFTESTNNRIFCGEFGVYRETVLKTHRNAWYKTVTELFENNNIPWVMWNYRGGFGMFIAQSQEQIPNDFNKNLLNVLGFKEPFVDFPESNSNEFIIYDDLLNRSILNTSILNENNLDLFCDHEAQTGRYCMQIADLKMYQPVLFTFVPDIVVDAETKLNFQFASDYFPISFQLIITDSSKTNYTYNFKIQGNYGVDKWNKISIPLALFEKQGTWKQGVWIPPDRPEKISSVSQIKLVNNKTSMEGMTFYIDEMILSKESE